MCSDTYNIVINVFQVSLKWIHGFLGYGGGQNLAIPITIAVAFCNCFYYCTIQSLGKITSYVPVPLASFKIYLYTHIEFHILMMLQLNTLIDYWKTCVMIIYFIALLASSKWQHHHLPNSGRAGGRGSAQKKYTRIPPSTARSSSLLSSWLVSADQRDVTKVEKFKSLFLRPNLSLGEFFETFFAYYNAIVLSHGMLIYKNLLIICMGSCRVLLPQSSAWMVH